MLTALPPGETVAPNGPVAHRAPRLAALRDLVSVVWTTTVDPRSSAVRVLPDAAVDVVVLDDRIGIAGPDTGPSVERLPGGRVVGLQVRPEAVQALLGVPASALRDLRLDISDLWGPAGDDLSEAVRAAPSLRDGIDLVEAALLARYERERLIPCVRGLREHVAAVGTVDADGLGVGERQLRRRCLAAFGYGPKVLSRVLRFQRALDDLRSAASNSLTEVAIRAGYVDQAHLARDVGEFTGLTPGGLRRAVVGDWQETPPTPL